eukprot:gene7760-9102_t
MAENKEPKKEGGLSKLFKGLKRNESTSTLKVTTMPATGSAGKQGSPSKSYQTASYSSLPSGVNLHAPDQNHYVPTSQSTFNLRSSSSGLSVKFQDNVTAHDDRHSLGGSMRPRSSSSSLKPGSSSGGHSDKKERFSFITRSLRKSKMNVLEDDSAPLPPSQHPRIVVEDDDSSRDSYVSANGDNNNGSTSAASSSPIHKRRNSIFVRLLRGKKDANEPMTEDDFAIDGDDTSSSASSPKLTGKVERANSAINVRTTLMPPASPSAPAHKPAHNIFLSTVDKEAENSDLREQLNEATNELRRKENEWRREKDDLIRKIQALSGVTTPPTPPTSPRVPAPPMYDMITHSVSLPHMPDNMPRVASDDALCSDPSAISKSPSIQSFVADSATTHQLASNALLSQSSSSLTFTATSTPGSSPPPPRRSHNRYTLAIPKWDDSMNFNGTPFERLVQALQNSCEIFPPADAASISSSSHMGQPMSSSNDAVPTLIITGSALSSCADTKIEPLSGSSDSQLSSTQANAAEERLKQTTLSLCLTKTLHKLIDENNDVSAMFIGKIKDLLMDIRNIDKESYNYTRMLDLCNQITYILETKISERGGMLIYTGDYSVVEKKYVIKKSNAKIRTFLSTSLKSMAGIDQHLPPSPPPSPTMSKVERVTALTSSPSHLSSSSIDHMGGLAAFETRPRSMTWSTSDTFLSIMDAPAKEIAKSLTVVDFSIFICIEPPELMNGVWGKPHLKDKALNISKLIARFNEISMNVIQTILNEEKLKDRCKVMAKFIKIAKNLHELRNYNSMMAIYAGISHSAVVRLKWTKKILPKVNQKILQDLEKLMENDENFKNYRTELKTITTPCIPFLGLILSDMTFIQEGNPDYIGVDETSWSLNFTKLKMVYNTIKSIQAFQKNTYLLNADPRLTLLLTPNFNIFGDATTITGAGSSSPAITFTTPPARDGLDGSSDSIRNSTGSDMPPLEKSSDSVEPFVPLEDKERDDMNKDQARLFRSFTLDGETSSKRYYNYNTWSPNKKSIKKRHMKASLKVERSQSETNLPLFKDLVEHQTHQLLDSIIRGDFTDTANFVPSPINVMPLPAPASPPITITATTPPITIATPSRLSLEATPTNGGSVNENDVPRKNNRHKSVSTSNIFGVLTPGKDSIHQSALAPKSHNRSSSISTWGGLSTSPSGSIGSSGNISPSNLGGTPGSSGSSSTHTTPPPQQHHQPHSIISNSNSHSFSIFTNKRKSTSVVESRTPPHQFAPMTDEGLFSLSLRLEPRGVKYQDLL